MYLLFLTLAFGIKVVRPEKSVSADNNRKSPPWQDTKINGLIRIFEKKYMTSQSDAGGILGDTGHVGGELFNALPAVESCSRGTGVYPYNGFQDPFYCFR